MVRMLVRYLQTIGERWSADHLADKVSVAFTIRGNATVRMLFLLSKYIGLRTVCKMLRGRLRVDFGR